MNENPNRAEAERLLGVAEKLLQSRDFNGTRDFAVLAQETEPLLEGSDQILAVADVLIASEKRINNHSDWYSILQLDHRTDDLDHIKKQYRRLALLLHPDKNKYPFADQAFKLVADAWATLSDSLKKSHFDTELGVFSRVELSNFAKLPVRRSQRPAAPVEKSVNINSNNSGGGRSVSEDRTQKLSSFWTACPYCFILYEYPRVYQDCCLRCQSCERAFHAALVPSLPPLVPGKDAYYCCWGFFPLGFTFEGEKSKGSAGFPNWMPPMYGSGVKSKDADTATPVSAPGFGPPPVAHFQFGERNGVLNFGGNRTDANANANANAVPISTGFAPAVPMATAAVGRGGGFVGSGKKKRGRPRKYPASGQGV